MRNILLEIEYDGTEYHGWQFQPNKQTIQGTIESALIKLLQEPINLIGASRTDAGVSALGQIANFQNNSRLSVQKIKIALNTLLPRNIYIKNVYSVHLLFNARFDAKSKLYRYQIILGNSPLRQRFAWELKYPVDLAKMEEAAKLFLGEKDFAPFCSVSDNAGMVNLTEIKILRQEDNLKILLSANRFLYKMVRRVVGSLIDVGRGKISKNDILKSLSGKSHRPFQVVPAHGLILVKVKY